MPLFKHGNGIKSSAFNYVWVCFSFGDKPEDFLKNVAPILLLFVKWEKC